MTRNVEGLAEVGEKILRQKVWELRNDLNSIIRFQGNTYLQKREAIGKTRGYYNRMVQSYQKVYGLDFDEVNNEMKRILTNAGYKPDDFFPINSSELNSVKQTIFS